MRKITMLLISAFMALSFFGFSQGLENFNNSNASGSYADNNFVGEGGLTWYFVASRDANSDANGSGIDLPALMLRRASSGSTVYCDPVSGGIGNFSVKLYKGFTGSGNRQVELFVNDVSYGTSTVFDDFNEHVFTVNNVNVSGSIVIRIDNITSKQVIVDDITWTGFGGGGNIPPSIANITQIPSEDIVSSSTVSVSADVTDSDGTIAGVELHWGTTSGSLGTTINMSNTGGDTYTTDTDIPAQADGTTVYYEVYALDDGAAENTSPEQSYTVIDPAVTALPYAETFDADLGDCYTYSVSGPTKQWSYGSFGGNGFADLNGFNSGDTEEDWLILPGIDFDSYSGELMSFDTWNDFGTNDANNYLKLYYSSDYSGIGDPSGSSWTEIAFTQGGSTWTSSGIIDLSAITGTAVYIAFEYHYESGSYKHWEVDNISIVPSVPVNVTFQVNMSDEGSISGDGVHVAGSFNSWDPTATLMTDAGGGIYTVTLPLMSNVEYQFKYLNGNAWGTDEAVPTGCETGGNRTEFTSSPDYSIPVVCFGSCVDCGGAYFDITFQVDMQNETVSGDGVYLAGSFTDWQNSAIAMTQNGTIWSTTVSLQENSPEEYKFVNGDPNNGGNWEFIGNRTLTIPSANTILDVDCFNSYDPCPVSDFVIINEVDVDTPGTDAAEFIELYDGGVGNTSLSGLVVVLYNGNGDASYNSYDLDGFSTDGNGYFLLGNSGVVPTPSITFPSNTLQNGADAISLYIGDDTDFPNGTAVTTTNLLDALVYDTNDGDDSGLLVLLNPGEPQVNEGGRGNQADHSNQRLPNGSGGQRNTNTYDQAIPTPGAVNVASFTDWTGLVDTNWDDAGNWSFAGIPDVTLGATIPDVTPNSFPVITGSANCMSLYMAGGSSLDISPSGDLTIVGSFTNNGSLTVKSDATGTGSLIEGDGVYATVERFYTGTQWHLISSPVSDETANMFYGLYLQSHDEPSNIYSDVTDETTPLNPMQGYALWNQNGNATASFMGTLNTGALSYSATRLAPNAPPVYYGWNLVGNPYPSSIDWLAASGWTKTNIGGTIYLYTGSTWATFSIPGSGTNGGTQYVAPGQGFFVSVNDDGSTTGTLAMDNGVRVHNPTTFFKDEIADRVKLQVANGELTDETVIMFNENATVGFDGEFDAHKLFSFNTEVPQIYSTANGFMAANVLPEISSVAIDVRANDGDVLNINAIETSEFAEVYLEDTYTGIITKLISESYTFIYNSDVSDRFVVHFGALDIEDNIESLFTVYSANDQVIVIAPENTNGEISIYNMMGQEVLTTQINGTINTIALEKSAYYVVKVVSNESIVTKKVFIK